MKKLITLFASAALIFSLTSCDELDNLLKVTFEDVEVEETFEVETMAKTRSANVLSETELKTFSKEIVFFDLNKAGATDTTQEEQLADYLDDITSVELTMLKFTILGMYMGNALPNFSIPTMTISISQDTTVVYTEVFTDVTTDQVVMATLLGTNVVEQLSTYITDKKELTFKAEGEIVGDISKFEMKLNAVADVAAGLASGLTGADS